MSFTCQICFDEKSQRLELPHLATGNGDVLRTLDCNHPICMECLATHIRVRVEEQRAFQLRCPMDGCSNELFEQDVQRLVKKQMMSSDVFQRFAALRARDFNARSKSFDLLIPYTDEDLDFVFALREMRLCPRCKLVIQRSEGCNSFFCVCGTHFNYANAARPVGHNFAKFRWTAQLARSRGVSLEEAARYGGDIRLFKKANLTASRLGISRDAAHDLHRRAKEGDEDARARIRAGRCSQHRERRIATDGWPYTLEQFQSYYGASSTRHWEEAGKMILRPLQGRSPRLLGFTEEERSDAVDRLACCHAALVKCSGSEKDSKLWHASRYEVKVFGAWLPLAQLLACDYSIPRNQGRAQDALTCSRSLPKLMASRHQLSRWNRSTRMHTGSASALHSKQRLGRHAMHRCA